MDDNYLPAFDSHIWYNCLYTFSFFSVCNTAAFLRETVIDIYDDYFSWQTINQLGKIVFTENYFVKRPIHIIFDLMKQGRKVQLLRVQITTLFFI